MANTARTAASIAEVVANGLCIGCGLCEAVTFGKVRMEMTPAGSLRPTPRDRFSEAEEKRLLAICPGVTVEPRTENTGDNAAIDPVWGQFRSMRYAWAGDSDVRFKAATGGALTALAAHLIATEQVRFVLHVHPDPDQPMRSRWVISETVADAVARAGSRYGPVAPLAGFVTALDRGEPFALVAKPCDVSAVHRFAQQDRRVDALCVMRLAMVCGGQSRLSKSNALLDEFGCTEDEVSVFRYLGYGNPGRTRIETRDGRAFEKTYQELWEDLSGWELETRCKLCPDALGEATDIAAADVWPGGGPTGEDAGFNGIIIRSAAGERLAASAVASGDLIVGQEITPRQFDDFQPHQVRKKVALAARYEALAAAGRPVIAAPGLRLDALGARQTPEARAGTMRGTQTRVRNGKFDEPL